MKPTISVQIVTFNSSSDIISCLKSISKQTYPIDQVIIVDNNSSDLSDEMIVSMKNSVSTTLTLIRNKENLGFAPAHNQALQYSDSDYVLVLNPDVILHHNYISEIISCINSDLNIGSATGMLVRKENKNTIDSTGLTMNGAWKASDRGAEENSSLWNKSDYVFGVSGAAAIYSRKMILDISIYGEFFDSDFFAYKEDVDVAWRANLLGWKSYYCASAIAYHERGWKKGGRKKQPLFIRQVSYINRYKMIYKNFTQIPSLIDICKLIIYELTSNMYILFREPKVLAAWINFIRSWPTLKKKRSFLKKRVKKIH